MKVIEKYFEYTTDISKSNNNIAFLGGIEKEIHEGLHGQACVPRGILQGFSLASSKVVLGMFFLIFCLGLVWANSKVVLGQQLLHEVH